MTNIFEDIKKELEKESEHCLPELKKIIINTDYFYKNTNLISKKLLQLLLEKAIEKIAELENLNYYEMDAMDNLCEKEFIFENLIKVCIEHCELFNKGE